jgi:hypothetical protein
MRHLYFCALVLGFVGFFGNRINARTFRTLAANCPTKVFCDYHNTYAWFVLDERINGRPYRLYAHGSGSKRHELRRQCED